MFDPHRTMPTLTGKVAVVTGASSGQGLAAARHFVEEGAFVFITGREPRALERVKAKLGDNVVAIEGDVANLRDVEHLYSVVREVKGHVDIVFAGEAEAPSPDYFDDIFNFDVRGVMFAVEGALPLMRDGGSIMIDGSIASSVDNSNVAGEAQGAIRALARDWTFDLAGRHIRACVTGREVCDSCAAA